MEEEILQNRHAAIRKASGNAGGISLALNANAQFQAFYDCADTVASLDPLPPGVKLSNLGDGLFTSIPVATIELDAMQRVLAALAPITSVALVDSRSRGYCGAWVCFCVLPQVDDEPFTL